jgi:hypothetical protein
MSDAHKAPGQNMPGKAADELHGLDRHKLLLASFPVIQISILPCITPKILFITYTGYPQASHGRFLRQNFFIPIL